MAKPALVLDVFVGFPSYGGNGGISSEVPDIREWWVETLLEMKADPRVGEVHSLTIADTPITMVRNQFVELARKSGAHLLMMVDSDQNPNLWKKNPKELKPFWKTAFDEIYAHYQAGPLVIGAPYCGPPGAGENVYVFFWDEMGNRSHERPLKLEQYQRQMAVRMTGIQEAGALPTGLILYDMRAFELIEPSARTREAVLDDLIVGKITKVQALAELEPGWFKYEWTDGRAIQKGSTEDVQNTRDISLAGQVKLGYNPVRVAWDCWIGHWKPWCVGKPDYYSVRDVAATLRRSVELDLDKSDKIEDLNLNVEGLFKANPVYPAAAFAEVLKGLPIDESTAFSGTKEEAMRMIVDVMKTPKAHVQAVVELAKIAKQVADREWDAENPLSATLVNSGDKSRPPLKFLEVGAWIGDTGKAVRQAVDTNYYVVDPFTGNPNDITGDLVKAIGGWGELSDLFQKNHTGLCQPSSGVSWDCFIGDLAGLHDAFHKAKFDLIFLDANHDYESVKRDLAICLQHLTPGGILCGHDFGTTQFPGVEKAVREVYDTDGTRHGQVFHFDRNGGIFVFSSFDHVPTEIQDKLGPFISNWIIMRRPVVINGVTHELSPSSQ